MGESFVVGTNFVIKVQLKDLTHMLCLLMSFYKVYKEGAFSFDFTFKIMCNLGCVQRSLTLKAKH
jgi:hypothetical protein